MAIKPREGAPQIEPTPKCLTVVQIGEHLPVAINFFCPDGRVFGFPYAHLVTWLYEKNPDAGLHPNAPADRFSLWFSTHDVVLSGWRLSSLPIIMQQNKLVAVQALESRYFGLSGEAPFVSELVVKAQKQAAE